MGIKRMGRAWMGVLLVLPLGAVAGEEWDILVSGPITVKTREVSGSVKEIWAEGVMDAEVQDVQSAILDAPAYPKFMPYFKESRVVGKTEAGHRLIYSRMALPFVQERDYVVRVEVLKRVKEDGSGEFANQWEAVKGHVPERDNTVRLTMNKGGWHAVPTPDGRARVTYRVIADPGTWVPSFAIDMGNKKGIPETFRAVEKEAKERGARRKQQASVVPHQGTGTAFPLLAP